MNKQEIIKKYFPNVDSFRGVQEEAIDSLLEGEKVLCLMPTGGGKTLIFQVTGLALEKTTLVISPLVALMEQQSSIMNLNGISALNFSGMDGAKQFRTITKLGNDDMPKFIFISPERLSNDGYLEYVLSKRRDDIGLVVIDEVHCVSQWGEGFRPLYRNIPPMLDRVFGTQWPRLLCLTATLNAFQQKEVEHDFQITKTIIDDNLWRENLNLEIINIKDGKDDTKDSELERIIEKHLGSKILVFAHRKYGNKGTTRTLYEKYKDVYEGVAYFDSGMADSEKKKVLEGFSTGEIKIVFATSAFGMGVDIGDIRVVVNYLISETVEQYYQEVGRGGRDGEPAFGYLLYTNQSRRGRMMLLNNSLCTEKELINEWEDRKLKEGKTYGHLSYESMEESQRIAFSLLQDYHVLSIVAKGVQSIKCFTGVTQRGKEFLKNLEQYSRAGYVTIICKKTGKNINSLTLEIWNYCLNGDIKLKSSLSKTIFYVVENELDDELVKKIIDDQENKKRARIDNFTSFVDMIEQGLSAEQIVRKTLDI